MAGPSLSELQKPMPVSNVLYEQQKDFDCMPCRLMGSATFTGLGIYTYASGRKQLAEREAEILRSGSRFGLAARRYSVFGLSAGLVGVGVYRLIN